MPAKTFDDLADAYEAMIDWSKRLGYEESLYRRIFQETNAHDVLDVACGTGHHVSMFHSWGLRVEAADASELMIRRCKQSWGEPPGLNFILRSFDQPVHQPARFDVAICVGNSLSLSDNQESMRHAIAHMLAAVRSGGAVVIHVLNVWRLPEGPCLWQKCIRANLPRGDCLIIKGIHRAAARGYVNMLVTRLDATVPDMSSQCVPFWAIEAKELQEILLENGADRVELYGGYNREPYQRDASTDLIAIAWK